MVFTDFVLRNAAKALGEYGTKLESKTVLDLNYADDLIVLDENVRKVNNFLNVLRVQGKRIVLKIVKKTSSLRQEITDGEEFTFGSKKIVQVDNFTYLGSIISKDDGYNEYVKSRITKKRNGSFRIAE